MAFASLRGRRSRLAVDCGLDHRHDAVSECVGLGGPESLVFGALVENVQVLTAQGLGISYDLSLLLKREVRNWF
jgi:hypothetical protein